jgi:hypothetical protein
MYVAPTDARDSSLLLWATQGAWCIKICGGW